MILKQEMRKSFFVGKHKKVSPNILHDMHLIHCGSHEITFTVPLEKVNDVNSPF